MSTSITLYTMGQDEHDMNKSLTVVGTYECNLKTPVDAEKPEILLNATNVHANYAYIPLYGRYYYITPVTQHNNMMEYVGLSDVLMSFNAGIKASPAVIARNPWKYDKYIPDNKMPVESRTVKGTIKFPGTHFSGTNNSYILTTIGGGFNTYPDDQNNNGGE